MRDAIPGDRRVRSLKEPVRRADLSGVGTVSRSLPSPDFATVVASLPEGVVVQDADGRVVAANPRAEALLGLSGAALEAWAALELPRADALVEHVDGAGEPRWLRLNA